MSIDRFRPAIAQWAASFPAIRRVWLYGSRVKGTERPDSDLDVAVELDSLVLRGNPQFTYWMLESPAMKQTLSALIDVSPHVQLYHATQPEVFSPVAEHGILVYDKATQATGLQTT